MIRSDNTPDKLYNDRSAYRTAEQSNETLRWGTG